MKRKCDVVAEDVADDEAHKLNIAIDSTQINTTNATASVGWVWDGQDEMCSETLPVQKTLKGTKQILEFV